MQIFKHFSLETASPEQAELLLKNKPKSKYVRTIQFFLNCDFGSPKHLEYGLLCPIAEIFISQTMPVQGGLA
jgi:hypothetical protein